MSSWRKTPLIGFLLFFANLALFGQPVTEEEITIQKVFIEANGEKLLGNFDKAIALYEEVLKRDKNNHAASFELARIYSANSKETEAIKALKKATALAPTNVWYQQFLAEVYEKTGQFDEAAELYEGLVKNDPNNDAYYFRWAFFLVKANNIDKAIKAYDALEKQKGINEETIRRKHALYLGSGDEKKAGKELEKLVNAFPEQLGYQFLLANFYDQIGDKKNAESSYNNILKLDPENAKAKLALSGGNNRSNNDSQYIASLKSIFEQEDVNIDLKLAKIFPLINKVASEGDVALADEVIALTDILETIHPGNAKGFAVAGDLYYHSGRPNEALPKYLKTLQLDESVFAVWENVMYIHFENQSYKALQKVSEQVMDIFPNKAIIYYMNGVALSHLNELNDAIDALDQALLMSGQDGKLKFDVLNQMGETYNLLGQAIASDDAFTQALELNTQSAMTYLRYAQAVATRPAQAERAKSLAEKGLGMAPKMAIVQAEYGRVFYLLSDYTTARKWMDKALSGGGAAEATVLEYYGDLLFQTGDTEQAIIYWNKSLGKGNLSPTLEKKIAARKLFE